MDRSLDDCVEPGQPAVQTLWIGEGLSSLEKLCLSSFRHHGHNVVLYAYNDLEGVPDGVTVRDGRSILCEDAIFRYGPRAGEGKGSVAAFSNLFRYKLLLEHGGWWVDMDVVCLQNHATDDPYVYGWQAEDSINTAVIKAPAGSPLMQDLYETTLALGQDVTWGETGPDLMTELVAKHGLLDHVRPREHFYPVRPVHAKFLFDADTHGFLFENLRSTSLSVHFWNEMLRRGGIDKNASYPPSSFYERLKALYGVQAGNLDR
jgi:hypothetical protein